MTARSHIAPASGRRSPLLFLLGALVVALTLNVVLWLAEPGLALVRAPWSFGPAVVRAEVVVRNGSGVQAYRVDRGIAVSVNGQAVVVRERDGLRVTVPVADGTRILVDGTVADRPSSIPKGARVEAIRRGDAPALRVVAVTRR